MNDQKAVFIRAGMQKTEEFFPIRLFITQA